MKIGIITLPLHTNYGGILQAFALQTVLEELGHKAFVLDRSPYKKIPYIKWPLVIAKRLFLKYILGQNVLVFYERYENRIMPIIRQNTQRFIDAHIHRVECNDFSKLRESDYGGYVVGSDQIWRTYYVNPIEHAYLDFTKDWKVKRIAYAASFGSDKWEYNGKQTDRCQRLIAKFDEVSVREDIGAQLCQQHLLCKAKHVLDPTMLLDVTCYMRIMQEEKEPDFVDDMLMVHILDADENKEVIIRELAKLLSLNIYRSNSDSEKWEKDINERIQPSVQNWLWCFYKAKAVITDSFHAIVFSLIFKKDFYVLKNEQRGNSRIESLLRTFGLENRIVENRDIFEKLPPINYDIVSKKLISMRTVSISVLKKFNKFN